VSSLSADKSHAIDALQYHHDWQTAKTALVDLIENMPRAKVVENQDKYLHAIFKSKIFGFVDDTEFLFDETRKVIHLRSAARLGYYDFGVNRRRVEMFRARLSV
jgi:uncharacterized protein (DUF1499 family)